MRRLLPGFVLALVVLAAAAAARAETWTDILARARGQAVHFNAWAGDEANNAFIAWVGERVAAEYGVTLRHVKIRDTSEAVARVLAEKSAGRDGGGSVDLVWINGENFFAMKQRGLLFGPFTHLLPHFALVDVEGKPTTVVDFTEEVAGLESPWRMAQVVFLYDTARVADPPRSIPAFLDWARANPGRLTYPQPRNFLGATFLKQALHELAPDPRVLARAADDAIFAATTAPLWAWLDALHPHLWRKGQNYPENGPAQRQLLADGEIDLSLSFNPAEASLHIARGLLPETVRTYVLAKGTIGNTSFVAIPYNAAAKEGAMVVADFLLSPEAQARAMDPRVLGNFTVLDLGKLGPDDRRRFAELPRGVATLGPEELGKPLPEPHPSWMVRVVAEWQKRYSR